MRVINSITDKLNNELLTERRLDACKKQYCGQLRVSADNAEFIAMRAGRGLLYYGNVPTIDETIASIQAVTPQDIANAAAYLRSDKLSSLTFMPLH
jgi:predicted Zn-dependent peptidase